MLKQKIVADLNPPGGMLPKALLVCGGLFAISPWSSSALALFLGVLIALIFGNPIKVVTIKVSQKLLMYSVVGLGAGMNLLTVAAVGAHGIGWTALTIFGTLLLGWLLARIFKTDHETGWLISFGTAICGGSAIAALAPVLRAKPHAITVSLGVVFLLNSVALLIFPTIGHFLNFSQEQFGLWSALAIHDTSSVVGAGLQYGPIALQIGTTVKLARALWIVPLTFLFGWWMAKAQKGESGAKAKKPWFILGFVLCAAVVTWVPQLHQFGLIVEAIARKGLVLTLFFIGANLTWDSLKQVGARPLLQGFSLWVIVATVTACLICND
jgi:uncharacterized integral membrane protein (TIGR00698 family)